MQPDEKKCPLCGETIKKIAVKCRFCGEFLDKAQGAAQDSAAFSRQGAAGAGRQAEGGDSKVYYQGNVSKVLLLGPYAYGIFAFIMSLVLLFMLEGSRRELGYYAAGILILSWAAYFLTRYFQWKSRSFRITGERVESETGILSKSIVNIDMWRVRDIRFEQTIFEKLLGVGSVSFFTPEKPNAPLVIGPIKEARKLYDIMKEVQVTSDRKRGVVRLES